MEQRYRRYRTLDRDGVRIAELVLVQRPQGGVDPLHLLGVLFERRRHEVAHPRLGDVGRHGDALVPPREDEFVCGSVVSAEEEERVREANGAPADSLLLLSGDDGTTNKFVLAGGDKCISVMANVAKTQMRNLMVAALKKDA